MENLPPRDPETTERNVRRIFVVSVILKGLSALIEIAGGILFFFTGALIGGISNFANGELLEDPTDFLATKVLHFLPYISTHSQLFGAFYLLSHGVIKIFLVVALLRNKLWAYPTAIVFLGLFIIYQIYRYTFTHSGFLILLTLFDILVIYLTWHEYKIVKKRILHIPQN